ncbi:MAG: branched-chain amino acid transaminase [Candidatus Diapherotrites archaeon]
MPLTKIKNKKTSKSKKPIKAKKSIKKINKNVKKTANPKFQIKPVSKIWLNGKFVNWNDAKVHFLTHALHYGSGVFEGIRCYKTKKGPAIFRLDEHLERLYDSEKILGGTVPQTKTKMKQIIIDLVKVNKLSECYIRPLVFLGYGQMGLNPRGCPIELGVAAWEWDSYLGKKGLQNGIKAKVSSYTRPQVNISMTKAKISGNYVNSLLAKREVTNSKYDEAIMLSSDGFVSECSAENLFIVRDGQLVTVPKATILEGITRDSVIQIAKYEEIPFKEERLTRDQLYVTDEVFMTGTAAEVTPVISIDDRLIGNGKPGPITKLIQNKFFDIVKGEDPYYSKWLTFVNERK